MKKISKDMFFYNTCFRVPKRNNVGHVDDSKQNDIYTLPPQHKTRTDPAEQSMMFMMVLN